MAQTSTLALGSITLLLFVASACGPSKGADEPHNGTASASSDTSSTPSSTSSTTSSGGGSSSSLTPSQRVAQGNADNGKKLFESEHCTNCHGTREKPPQKYPNLFKLSWDDSRLEEGFTIVKQGKQPMPDYGDKLDDSQIADILAFVTGK
ncbi:MAG: cytochrome c [Polyangiaceae bacterium]